MFLLRASFATETLPEDFQCRSQLSKINHGSRRYIFSAQENPKPVLLNFFQENSTSSVEWHMFGFNWDRDGFVSIGDSKSFCQRKIEVRLAEKNVLLILFSFYAGKAE
ncbi:hypothetical protein FRX31_026964 [Thalictrum thalictroides]|uniref:Uncharacterized protein n=1 Tax=Thalictrum thalictroides TaxID=46969 RepID=A0A7J6VEE9_THATH|nr:hypothetical protein FRX31_026964 [Thalictrum thalictroides]